PAIGVSADGDEVTFTQRRFRYLPDDGEATWIVPLLASVGGGEPAKVLLEDASTTVTLPGASRGLVVNAGGHGFYRVAYSPELLAAVDLGALAPVERSLLLDDTWASVLARDTAAADFLDLATRFDHE